jgi:NADPH2:quinone reductase
VARRGLLVVSGQADGPFPPLGPAELKSLGSLTVTAPSIREFIARRDELEPASAAVFAGLAEGWLTPRVEQTFALAEAADAHRGLASRRTTGALVLRPDHLPPGD